MNNDNYSIPSSGLTIIDMLELLWLKKKTIIKITFFITFVMLVWAILMTPVYRSTTVLGQPHALGGSRSSFGSLSGSLGGLSRLAGLGGKSGNFDENIAILQSRKFQEQFILENDLLPILYEDLWDKDKNTWKKEESNFIGSSIQSLRASLQSLLAKASGNKAPTGQKESKTGPSIEKTLRKFNLMWGIEVDEKTGLAKLHVDWRDPNIAAHWANLMVSKVNSESRQRAINENKRKIDFLLDKEKSGEFRYIRESLFDVLEQEIERSMLATAVTEYAFRVIDPAVTPEIRLKPRRALMVIMGGFLGGFIGIMWVLLMHVTKNARDELITRWKHAKV